MSSKPSSDGSSDGADCTRGGIEPIRSDAIITDRLDHGGKAGRSEYFLPSEKSLETQAARAKLARARGHAISDFDLTTLDLLSESATGVRPRPCPVFWAFLK